MKIKNKNVYIVILIILILILAITLINVNKKEKKADNQFNILTSFYPVYVMTLNITDGANNVLVSNMADKITGCIHDYTLNTSDLRKFENADVFVANGKNLEDFTNKIIELYPNINMIESAENIENLIEDEEEINAHIWLSIDNYILQVTKIAEKLAVFNSENKDLYLNNSKHYIESLTKLKSEYEELKSIDNKKAICLNEALDYLLRDLDIESINIKTDHEQSAISAENIKNIIDKMKKENIKIIFIDKNDSDKIARSLANETGAKIYTLDSEMSGTNSKDDYLNIMRQNLNILKNIEF